MTEQERHDNGLSKAEGDDRDQVPATTHAEPAAPPAAPSTSATEPEPEPTPPSPPDNS